jgi:hypothetical protein
VLAALGAARDASRAGANTGADTPAVGEDASSETLMVGEDVSAETYVGAEDFSAETSRACRAVSNADALLLMADTLLASGPAARNGGERYQVVVHVDAATLSGESDEGVCGLDHGSTLHAETTRRLACDASVVRILERDGKPLSIGRKSRSVPPGLRRALHSRDGGCRFPGCSQRRFVDAHHIEHWASGGRTELSNLVQLCRHHHRLLHEGRYRIDRTSRGGLLFRRADGRKVALRPVDRRGDPAEPARRNARDGLRITAETCVPSWDGSSVRHADVVERILRADSRVEPG